MNMSFISPLLVFRGNLSLLEIFLYFARGLKQMEEDVCLFWALSGRRIRLETIHSVEVCSFFEVGPTKMTGFSFWPSYKTKQKGAPSPKKPSHPTGLPDGWRASFFGARYANSFWWLYQKENRRCPFFFFFFFFFFFLCYLFIYLFILFGGGRVT